MTLCILVLFVTAFSSNTQLASARPNFLIGQSEPEIGLRRTLRGIFGRWEKVDTVPDYSSETIQYGVGGNVKVDKTQVYTDKEYDAGTGTTKNVETKLTGSSTGKKDAQVDLTYQSQGGEYQGIVVSNGEKASGGIEQSYRHQQGGGTILSQNLIEGSSEDMGENAGVKLTSTVKDCSSDAAMANCASAGLHLGGEKLDGNLQQTQKYNDETSGITSSNKNKADAMTLQANADQQEEFTASATQVASSDPIASANVNVAGSTGVALTISSSSNVDAGK